MVVQTKICKKIAGDSSIAHYGSGGYCSIDPVVHFFKGHLKNATGCSISHDVIRTYFHSCLRN